MSFVSVLSLGIGLIVAFYWGCVIRLVLKARRRERHSAHFLPPEPLGRLIRIVWYPTVALWIVIPITIGLSRLTHSLFTPLFEIPVLQCIAFLLAGVVLILTMICWRKMGRDWRMGIDPCEKNNLIVSGPFARVRHPIYALQQMLAILSVLVVPIPIMAIIALLEIVLLSFEAIREERHLLKMHGEVYRIYMQRTGRFIPALKSAT